MIGAIQTSSTIPRLAENRSFGHRISMEGGDSMIINHNLSAVFVNHILSQTEKKISKSIERLSSGLRINSAADDASGLAVSEKLRAQIEGLRQAQRNAQMGISLLQTGEGALSEIQSILLRLRELSIQAANSIYTREDRGLVQVEVSQLVKEINRVSSATEFNKLKLLDGTRREITLHIGPNKGQELSIEVKTMTAQSLGLTGLSVSTVELANKAIGRIDRAINKVSMMRAEFGAYQNRLEYTAARLSVAEENLTAAESYLRDTDIAEEAVNFARLKILEETGIAMLTQANLKPESVLKLLD